MIEDLAAMEPRHGQLDFLSFDFYSSDWREYRAHISFENKKGDDHKLLSFPLRLSIALQHRKERKQLRYQRLFFVPRFVC